MSNLVDAFGGWLKIVLPDSGTAERDQRLGVIGAHATTVTKQDIIDLVLAFYGAARDQPTIERLRTAMRDVDTGFGPKDGAELAVLVAGVLFEIIEKGGKLAAATALTILCADFGALGDNNHITDVVAKARHFIIAEGIRVREEQLKLPNLGRSLQAAMQPTHDEEAEDEEEPGAELEESGLKGVVNALADYGEKIDESLALIEARRAEQSDILYWLLSGRCLIAGAPLKGLEKKQAAILIGAQLADLTRQIPGPASASAVLSTLLDQCKSTHTEQVTLEACIGSIETTESEFLTERKFVDPVITPISFALSKAEENGWKAGWENAVKTQTRKSASAKYAVLGISEQLYREILLSRAMGED